MIRCYLHVGMAIPPPTPYLSLWAIVPFKLEHDSEQHRRYGARNTKTDIYYTHIIY